VNVETKEQSKQWMHTHSPNKPRKLKQTLSARKLMATVFWDTKGVLMVDFMLQGTTITSEVYCETLKKLRRAIQNKRRRMLSSCVVLLHDNVRLHTAGRTRTLLEQFKWELFDHPPYSPDLAPSDYHLFMHIKNWFQSQPFNNNEELKADVETWLSSMAADFFEQGIVQLIPRYDKCLNSGGDYIEK
jgi:histone-lysine N-methyltransferase SETMAR